MKTQQPEEKLVYNITTKTKKRVYVDGNSKENHGTYESSFNVHASFPDDDGTEIGYIDARVYVGGFDKIRVDADCESQDDYDVVASISEHLKKRSLDDIWKLVIINRIFVDKKYRKNGVAKQMMEELLEDDGIFFNYMALSACPLDVKDEEHAISEDALLKFYYHHNFIRLNKNSNVLMRCGAYSLSELGGFLKKKPKNRHNDAMLEM